MIYEKAKAGITSAKSSAELTAHLNKIDQAIDDFQCDFNSNEWLVISELITEKNEILKSSRVAA